MFNLWTYIVSWEIDINVHQKSTQKMVLRYHQTLKKGFIDYEKEGYILEGIEQI